MAHWPVSKHHNIGTLKSQLLISKTFFLIFRLVIQLKDKIKLKYLYNTLFSGAALHYLKS